MSEREGLRGGLRRCWQVGRQAGVVTEFEERLAGIRRGICNRCSAEEVNRLFNLSSLADTMDSSSAPATGPLK